MQKHARSKCLIPHTYFVCVSAKSLLAQKGYAYEEIDVSESTAREALLKKANGRKTVPQIFIGSLHVGGFDDLQTLDRAGELDKLMAK